MSARELCQALGISQATLSRILRSASNDVVAVGRGRSTRYAVLRTISGVPRDIPMFDIDEKGVAQRTGTLNALYGGAVWVQRNESGELYEGIPFFLDDMRPQGFLGRAFARNNPDLELPERITDWSEDHVIRALTARGDDTIGNAIIGEGSFQRFLETAAAAIEPIPIGIQGTSFDNLAKQATEGQPPGSSAGGERPKFTAYAELAGGGAAQVLVKFSPPYDSDVGQRWSDLLVCEAIAADVLSESAIPAARTHILRTDERTHLIVERFDRVGARGRRAVISLGALDDYYFGNRDNYTLAAARLERTGRVSAQNAATIRLIHCFGLLIGNTDMHFGNVSFFPEGNARYRLSPIYDMLPMLYSPVNDQLVEREFICPALPIQAIESWDSAFCLAILCWQRVAANPDISEGFKVLVNANEQKLARMRESSARSVDVSLHNRPAASA